MHMTFIQWFKGAIRFRMQGSSLFSKSRINQFSSGIPKGFPLNIGKDPFGNI